METAAAHDAAYRLAKQACLEERRTQYQMLDVF